VERKEPIKEFVDKYPPDVVLFIGAGASVSFGMPVMNQFFSSYFPDFSVDTLLAFKPKKDMDVRDIILLCMKEYYRVKQTYDLEDVIAYIDSIKSLLSKPSDTYLAALKLVMLDNYGPGLKTEIDPKSIFSDDIINNFKSKVERAQEILTLGLFDVYGKRIEPPTRTLINETYSRLFDLITKAYPGNIMVFTTNYDPCLDIFLKKRSFPVDFRKFVKTGFGNEEGKKVGRWSFNKYFENSNVPIVGYFNLHGSVLWKKESNAIYCNAPNKIPDVTDIKNAQLAMPLVDKGQDEFSGKMYSIYNAILDHKNNYTFICIGYSWRDERLRRLTTTNLSKKPDSKIIYIDLDPNPNRLQGIKSQKIIRVPGRFEDPKVLESISTYIF
jgi:hypothetical protein